MTLGTDVLFKMMTKGCQVAPGYLLTLHWVPWVLVLETFLSEVENSIFVVFACSFLWAPPVFPLIFSAEHTVIRPCHALVFPTLPFGWS